MTDKINYLFCPFTQNCNFYSEKKGIAFGNDKPLSEVDIIQVKEGNYGCSAIKLHNDLHDNKLGKVGCTLIKLLNQTTK
ncbi:MAG: hypothetical protein Q8Q86_02445 [Candidatus Daviesbacteria bacterium]|nr:hypothetical protein [Candidatus Daviesbacteria bacterium]